MKYKRFFSMISLVLVVLILCSCSSNNLNYQTPNNPLQDSSINDYVSNQGNDDISTKNLNFRIGLETTPLVLSINDREITFYYDKKQQELFAPKIILPAINGKYDFIYENDNVIEFFDMDGDGCDELFVKFTDNEANTFKYYWRWNVDDNLFESYVPAYEVTTINPYFIKADIEAYLSEQEISIFKSVIDGIFMQEDKVELTNDYDSNLRILSAIKYSPYYFFVENEWFSTNQTVINFSYKYNIDTQSEMHKFMNSELIKILNTILIYPNMNDVEKALGVYRYFSEHLVYDYDWLEGLEKSNNSFLYPDIEIYQALSTGKGVCHTYTYLCEFALRQMGVECLPISGVQNDSDTRHMWLLIKLNGKYYHCDPTWQASTNNLSGLQYFGMTDEERLLSGISIDTTSIDGAYGEIICNDETYLPLREVENFVIKPYHILELMYEVKSKNIVYFDTQISEFLTK